MAKTNAQRQADFRRRHLQDADTVDGHRINLIVSVQAKAQLKRLAARRGESLRTTLERIITTAEDAVLDGLSQREQSAYWATTDGKRRSVIEPSSNTADVPPSDARAMKSCDRTSIVDENRRRVVANLTKQGFTFKRPG